MKPIFLIASLIALTMPCAALAQTDNKTILILAKAGLGDGVIIDKIESTSCGYDVSTDGLIALKLAGISDNVISAMVRRCATLSEVRGVAGDDASADPKIRHSPGIYVFQDWLDPNKLQVLRPSKSSGLRSSGNGSIIFPLVVKMVVPGLSGQVPVTVNSPSFYFYFDPSNAKVSDFGLESSSAAQSPSEFSLVKFRAKDGSREVAISKASYYGGSPVALRNGIDPKYTARFDSEEAGAGIYKVTFPDGLDGGEYAFVFTGANGTARIYDFSVVAPVREKSGRKTD